MATAPRNYGWIPDLPDHRDRRLRIPHGRLTSLPARVDLRPECPPVLDQGELGACTAHALANAFRFTLMHQRPGADFPPSRLFIYYNERAIEGTIREDAGAMLRDGIKTIVRHGICPEKIWPYIVDCFAKKPPRIAYEAARRHQVLVYQRVDQTISQMKACLAAGMPFVFGFTVFASFESDSVAESGNVPMPKRDDTPLGGHAVMAVGYEDARRVFIVMNSWSRRWGDKGYCYLPYDYLTNPDLADDFWTLKLVEA